MTLALALGSTEVLIGFIQGFCYALLGLGLVLVFRASGVIHFGYGEIGAFGAVVLAKLVLDKGWPWWLATVVVVAAGAAIGAGWELVVVRRLADRPRIVLLVATIGMAQLMLVLQLVLPAVQNQDLFPTAFDLHQPLGGFVLRGDHVAVLVVVPAVALALAWFLNRSVTGLAIRGAAANADAASLAGVRIKQVSTIVWALAGALATLTFVLILPVRGYVFGGSTAALGPGLLLRALVVGLVGRMVSLPLTVVGGIVLGVAESVLLANVDSPGTVDMIVFLLLLGLLLARGAESRGNDVGQVLVSATQRIPAALRAHPAARRAPGILLMVALAAAAVLPFLTSSPARQFTFAKIAVFALAGLSVTVVTGWAGQLSLCQFAFVGVGAFSTAGLTARGMGFVPAAAFAVVLTAACACLIGFPALRIRGLFLAMATLGFSVASQAWLLQREVFRGPADRATVRRGSYGPVDLANQRTYYFVCVSVLAIVAVALARLRRSGVGLGIVAVRDNEPAASASTLSPAALKLLAFGLSGGVAGLAGALLGGLFVDLHPNDFGPEQSILLLTMTIIGGVGSVAGSLLGALYVIGLPNLFEGSTLATLLVSGAGLLVLVLWAPGGLLEVVQRGWRAMLERWIAPATPIPDPVDEATLPQRRSFAGLPVGPRASAPRDDADLAVSCRDLEVRFGGLVANRSVDLDIRFGETVGLIGTNGAGKSTLLNAIAGSVPLASGSVAILGQDVSGWPPHLRADLGMGRVFQDARLFGQLTVIECLLVALEARRRSEFVPSLLGLPPARRDEATKRRVATELVDLCGLGPYADRTASELSTGTRRICELAALIAGGAQLLLLDEPTAGVAQREVEAFGDVIREVQRQLGATVLLIEHDMPLVMSLCERVVCMTAGEVIADGAPDVIRSDPKVIAAYLGTDDRAIDRSDLVRPRD